MENSKGINLQEFRKEYEIAAAPARSIIDKLGLSIEKVGDTNYIVGTNKHGVSNEYILKHAVLEFRRTMDIQNTLIGNFFEFNGEVQIDGRKVITEMGVSKIDKDLIKPSTPSLKKTPNASNVGITAQSSAITPAPIEDIQPIAAASPDALSALVAALTAAQQPSAPKDVLMPQKQLLEASQQQFLLTSSQLAELLGMSAATISSKKSGFIKLGFKYEKVKEGASTLWKVIQPN